MRTDPLMSCISDAADILIINTTLITPFGTASYRLDTSKVVTSFNLLTPSSADTEHCVCLKPILGLDFIFRCFRS